MLDEPVGPVVVVQLVAPATPVIVHEPLAVGAVAPIGPVRVAVKCSPWPRAGLAVSALTLKVGVTLATEVV